VYRAKHAEARESHPRDRKCRFAGKSFYRAITRHITRGIIPTLENRCPMSLASLRSQLSPSLGSQRFASAVQEPRRQSATSQTQKVPRLVESFL
jgi:hypothetical protein